MKKAFQAILQRLLGFERYLYWFFPLQNPDPAMGWPTPGGGFQFLGKMLAPDAVTLDIGANIGIMTVLIARQCPQGQVIAFEPVPDNYRTLQRVVRAYRLRHVRLHPLALGERPAQIRMAMPVLQGVRMQGLSHVEHQSIEGYEADHQGYEVQQMPLDELDFLQDVSIHAIKMDVENYEQFVLAGGRNLLRRHHPMIYCELWDNENRQRCFDILQDLDYDIQVLVDGQLTAFDPQVHSHHNFFFMPPQRG